MGTGDLAAWKAQDAAIARLPEALVSAFTRTEQDFYTHSKVITETTRCYADAGPVGFVKFKPCFHGQK